MLRNSLSKMTLTVALLFATLAWSGFMALNTVLDPGRSERVADVLLDDPYIQDRLAESLASGARSVIPSGVEVSDSDIDAAAASAVTDERLAAAVHGSVVASHARMLGDKDAVVSFDGAVIAAVSRDALVRQRPDLAEELVTVPTFMVTPPTSNLPNLGAVRRGLMVLVPFAAMVALSLSGAALIVAKRRDATLWRMGRWAALTALGWTALALLGPHLVRSAFGAAGATLAAVLVAVTAPVVVASVALCAGGVIALFASRAWGKAIDDHARQRSAMAQAVSDTVDFNTMTVGGPMRPRRRYQAAGEAGGPQ